MRKSYLLIWAGIALLIGFFWFYFPTLSRYQDLKIEEDRITRELADLDAKIKALQEERHLLKNDMEYLEKVIRRELGLVKPGEIVYKLVPEEEAKTPEKEKLQESPASPKTEPPPVPSANPPSSDSKPPLVEGAPVYPRRETR